MDSFHFAAFIVWEPSLFPCEQSRMSNVDNMQRQLKITDKVRKVIVITDVRRDLKRHALLSLRPFAAGHFSVRII